MLAAGGEGMSLTLLERSCILENLLDGEVEKEGRCD